MAGLYCYPRLICIDVWGNEKKYKNSRGSNTLRCGKISILLSIGTYKDITEPEAKNTTPTHIHTTPTKVLIIRN